ncbi:cupin domain-containing protein [Burkholderia cepacia]|uniref:Cupin domain-containing protein n=1 Tax=Burkholderia cepacia TaxID=292 RepID=A0A8I1AS43_BURCE|nr:AraC family transcriptional regulator [Burkholderia cepacia]MBA9897766.1 AraC family transcriptional regulator [Burkholderia cepacia]MBA9944488.1 AraC family transcriptional regulator [Burkholderia cepacia]MBA9974923.1 AraC family transcriptional regulator [Burkholderia cepacia]MBA9992972.1 AraC family transcriptional regulator [Burkholderia cepacia]MBB0001003.1 AraC family transcriptional regulator [Burkholderia cepacia]
MTLESDWLSRFMALVTVTGKLEIRCAFGAPWAVTYERSPACEIPYHVVLRGRAILENPDDGSVRELGGGDLVLLPHGSPHVLHDGSGLPPMPAVKRPGGHVFIGENAGTGERLDMLCGRFVVAPPHDRLIRRHLPADLVVRAVADSRTADALAATARLTALVELMRAESLEQQLGGLAILDALSAALFALALRAISESGQAPTGLLALAGQPRLAPAIVAMLDDPARPWTLPELAALCSMSRATFMRHFQSKLGHSAADLLTDIRMSLAANALRRPSASAEAVSADVGYQSVAAFRRVFTRWAGMTPGEWRRQSFGGPRDAAASDDGVAGDAE